MYISISILYMYDAIVKHFYIFAGTKRIVFEDIQYLLLAHDQREVIMQLIYSITE